MVKSTFDVLNEPDKKLVLETEPKKLKALDEDALVALHTRVRRARNRHTKNYRREAGGRVKADRSRAMASKKSRLNSARAEVMEEALARVSRVLADRADEAAEALRTERISQARNSAKSGSAIESAPRGKAKGKGKRKGKPSKPKTSKSSSRAKAKKFTPSSKKARASSKASGKRAQAKRDSRG